MALYIKFQTKIKTQPSQQELSLSRHQAHGTLFRKTIRGGTGGRREPSATKRITSHGRSHLCTSAWWSWCGLLKGCPSRYSTACLSKKSMAVHATLTIRMHDESLSHKPRDSHHSRCRRSNCDNGQLWWMRKQLQAYVAR